MTMKNPPHPGLSVRQDCLDPLKLTFSEAATHLGTSCNQVSDIVNCRASISPEMAIRWRCRNLAVHTNSLRLSAGDEASRPNQGGEIDAGGVTRLDTVPHGSSGRDSSNWNAPLKTTM